MRTLRTWLVRALVVTVALLTLTVVTALTARAIMQAGLEDDLRITTVDHVDDAYFVTVNGREHWITIRGHDRHNPVLFMLHGGPGVGNGPLAPMLRAYEERYTVVQWDQPGVGRTFGRAGHAMPADVTLESIAADGIGLAELVRARLGVDKVIVLGWSWGSAVGIEMARRRPDLFAAYVGTGQLVSPQSSEAWAYEHLLRRARELNDTAAIAELEAIGAPPYDSIAKLEAERRLAAKLTGGMSPLQVLLLISTAPRHSLADVAAYLRGMWASQDHFMRDDLSGPLMSLDLATRGTTFDVPVVFIHGTGDVVTPAELASEYFARLTAPHKVYVPIDGGHLALIENTADFLAALEMHVRPLAL